MRLGDLDALYEKVDDHVTSVSVCATVQQAIGQTDFKRRCLEDIHNAPTIDAIPVEWLKEHDGINIIDSDGNIYARRRRTVEEALSMWQREQEAHGT